MCARLQTRSREPPDGAQPASGRHPAQTATGAEEETGRLSQSDFHMMIHTEAANKQVTLGEDCKYVKTQTEIWYLRPGRF